MNPEKIRQLLVKQPFEPFAVVTSSGERYEVRHPDAALLTPGTLVVAFGKRKEKYYSDDAYLSPLHITALEPLVRRNGTTRKRSRK